MSGAFTQRLGAALVAGLTVLAAACGGSPAQPVTPTSTSTAASPSAAPSAVAVPAPAGSVRLTIQPAESQARYVARELLASNTIQTDAIGATKGVRGQVVVGPSGEVASGSRISVDLQGLTSDRSQRDNFIKRNTLQTDRFPMAEFIPKDAPGLPWPLPTSGHATFTLLGDLTVRGVTRPATWDVVATFAGEGVTGTATTLVRLDTFGVSTPRVPVVASIDDDIRLEVEFSATRAA